MNFGMIQKVYTIWLCFEPPAGHVKGGINGYSTVETCIDGDIKEPIEDYTLLNAFVVYVGEQQTGDKLINLLRLIFKEDLNATEKKNRLRDEYNLQLTEEMGEELIDMCNLSEGIEERAIEKEKTQTILRLVKAGADINMLSAATKWSQEKIKKFLASKKIVLAK